ncbi:MAG TPA: ATP12 family protein [Rhizomicrobium sp.]|nr:ATP12 family protein [Rhizomicrobium sp.]
MRRFYKDVSVAEESGAFRILLDGKPVKTPSRKVLAAPTRALAEAIAEEWRGQAESVQLADMIFTRLATAGTESVPANRGHIAEQILGFGKSDLLCYRAEAPRELAAHQAAAWDPLLDWAHRKYGARLAVSTGILFVEQPAEALLALEKAVWDRDDFALAALHAVTSITGSLVLALALAERRLTAGEAFAASRLDETFQAEKWGQDAEAEARAARLAGELAAAGRFLRSLDA